MIVIVALIVIPKRRKPTAAMAWLLAIFLIPYVGIMLYLLIGNFRLPKKRRDEQARINALITERVAGRNEPARGRDVAAVVPAGRRPEPEAHRAARASAGNSATLLGDYTGSIDAMAAEIDTRDDVRARRVLHRGVGRHHAGLLLRDGARRRARGHACGSSPTTFLREDRPVSKETFAELDRIGVKWAWMLPVMPFKGKYQRPDLRNHRKIVVVDGRVAFMGSQNLIDRTYDSPKNIKRGLKWQELVTRAHRPGRGIRQCGLPLRLAHRDRRDPARDRARARGRARRATPSPDALVCQVVPSGPGYTTENNLRLFLSLIYGATEKVILTSPYFVPDEAMVYAITTACQRGLEVQLFVSEIGDQGLVYHAQRSYYERPARGGRAIFLYPAPYILHSKHFSIDDDIAVIGSSNMDIRSFSLNMEVSLLVRGKSFVAQHARGRAGLPGRRPRTHPGGVARRAGQGDVPRRPRPAHLGAELSSAGRLRERVTRSA